MTNRELFHATMCRENGDQLLHFELGFNVPYKTWYEQGMPKHVQPSGWAVMTKSENLFDHLNVTGFMFCQFNQFCIPAYEEKIIKDDGENITFINERGNTLTKIGHKKLNRRNDGSNIGSPPTEIDFAIKNGRDYEKNRYRYIGNIKQRYIGDIMQKFDKQSIVEDATKIREQGDYIISLWVHGPFAYLRELLGTENAMIMPYEEPKMIRMILKDHLETSKAASERIIKECRPDTAFVWEDCCGSTGPFIAPSMFDEEFAWWYKEWKDYCLSMGIKWVVMDTDGDPSPLVTRWYESGIDCIHPWEVNGVDMLKFANEYPQYVMMGGIYKHMFEPNHPGQIGRFKTNDVYKAIDQELERVVKPMQRRGGYIPSLDHGAFWSIQYDHYKYYSNKLLEYGKANVVTRNFS